MAIQAGAAMVKVYADSTALQRGLRMAQRRLQNFGSRIQGLGLKMMGLGASIVAPLLGAVTRFAAVGDKFNKMAARTGVSTEALSELGFAAEQSGADLDTLEAGIKGMQRTILNAGRGLSTAVDALDDLGISYKKLDGLSPEEQFKLIAQHISQVEDPSKRAALAMQIFGRAGQRMVPLLNGGASAIEALQEEARELGLTVSTDQAQAAADFTDAWNRVKRALGAAAFAVGSALAPMLTDLLQKIKTVAVAVGGWISSNKAIIKTVFAVGLGIMAAGAAFVVFGTAVIGLGAVFSGLATVLGTITTVLGAILSPIGLVTTAVVGLAGYLVYTSGAGGQAIDWLVQQFQTLKNTVTTTIGAIGQALAAGDISLAAKVLWSAIQMEFQRGLSAIQQYWTKFKFGAARIFTETWSGIQTIWTEAIAAIKTAWVKLVSTVVGKWRSAQHAITQGLTYVMTKAQGLDEDIIQQTLADNDRMFRKEQAGREESARERVKAIRDERDEKLATIGEEQATAMAALDRMKQEELSAAEQKFRNAKKEWEQAVDEAKKKAQEIDPEKAGPDFTRSFGTDLGGAVDAAERRIAVQGTFNAMAARGLGVGGAAERTARATEQIEKNTKQLVTEIKQGGLVFVRGNVP